MAKPNLRSRVIGWRDHLRVIWLARQVAQRAHPDPARRPVVMFNATARLSNLSQNAAFSLLTSWGLRLAGVPVKHFVCQAGLSHCVLGVNRQDYKAPPPCQSCVRQSRRLYSGADARWFTYQRNSELASALQRLSVDELSNFQDAQFETPLPLGGLVLPAARWTLRRHTLPDDEQTRYLLREFILSAHHLACEFAVFLEAVQPSVALIFNGIMYPEATARWVALQRGVPVITHEVGFQRYSAFFTYDQATAYPIYIPDEFDLTAGQNARLDAYLEKRFQGQFTMAGIRFWPEMRGLDEAFLQKAAQFRQIVPIFTNVVYDTSQVHANQVFPQMFAWLDLVLELIRAHPETLFVIRAHPDEMRPGTAKQSRESVRDWVLHNRLGELPNVIFIDSQEYISSYELIQRAKFVLVYNSSIGMEAALMGAAVLCGGKARYTQYPIVFFPKSIQAYRSMAEDFLARDGASLTIDVPPEFQRNARRFLYYQLFRASLSFEDYLADGPRKGFVKLKPFSWRALLPENAETISTLLNGIARPAPALPSEVHDERRDSFPQRSLSPQRSLPPQFLRADDPGATN